MKKVRTLVVDDEPHARMKLRTFLAAEKDIELVAEAGNGDEAIRLIGELRPDLLFLDIQMPRPDGIGVLRAVRDEWLPCTIFTTAHAEYAVEAFALHALDYLLKPFSCERLAASLSRARAAMGQKASGRDERVAAVLREPAVGSGPAERFLVKSADRYVVVRANDIRWIEAAANYVVLHTPTGNHILRRSISALEAELDPRRFFRSSRSTMVNLEAVREVQLLGGGEHVIFLHDDTCVPLTRGLREFQERLEAPNT